MTIRDRRQLKAAAADSLANAGYDPKKLVLIHTAAVLLVSALLVLVDCLLEQQISATGGLSGVGQRTVLATVQQVLSLGQSLLLPFWQIGYLYATLRISRGQTAGPDCLLEGFRRFFPVLRLLLLQGAIYFGIAFLCSYLAGNLIFFTPWGDAMVESLLPLLTESGSVDSAVLEEAVLAATEQIMIPLLGLFAVLFLALSAPVFYRYRMSRFLLMDHPGMGALAALRLSRAMTRRQRIALFRLDLSFWWFYLADALVTLISFANLLLPLAGVTLPDTSGTGAIVFYLLYLVCQLGLYWAFRNPVAVTYAHAYAALLPKPEDQP